MARVRPAIGGVRRWHGAALAWLLGPAAACGPSERSQCDSVVNIGIATGRSECQYTRDFYTCLVNVGCYDATAGCRSTNSGELVACRERCESEPGLATCVDTVERTDPAEDYHLCPHIPKVSYVAPPPSEADFLAAPSLPFTVTVWLDFESDPGDIPPATLFPTLFPAALQQAMAGVLGLHAPAVRPEPPALRLGALRLPGTPPAPEWALHTYFITVNIHVLNASNLALTHDMVEAAIIGPVPTEVTSLEDALADALTTAMPANASLTLQALKLNVISGTVEELPFLITTTTPIPTTSTLNPSLFRRKWRAWRVRCLGGTVHRWEIRELQLWVDGCPRYGAQVRLLPDAARADLSGARVGSVISSGDVSEPGYGGEKAFDGQAESSDHAWMSSCAGCAAGEAWLGLDAGTGPAFSSRCAVIKEGETATSQCHDIVVEASDNLSTWYPRGRVNGFDHEKELCLPLDQEDYPSFNCGSLDDGCGVRFTFGDCPGDDHLCQSNRCYCPSRKERADPSFAGWECGQADDGCGGILDFGTCTGGDTVVCEDHKCKDRAGAANQWRLVCASGTSGRWWVSDLVFHSEGMCYMPERSYQAALSSGSYDAEHDVVNAFDNNRDTFWGSRCNKCRPGEAWLGLDFGFPVAISCIEFFQEERTLQQCRQLTLESSDDGAAWLETARYGFGGDPIRASTMLTFDLDSRTTVEELHRSQRFAPWWRLVCAQELQRQWTVVDIEWYDDTECSNRLRGAMSGLLHSRSASWPASNAFDSNPETVWKTGCGRCSEAMCEPCRPGEAYIGSHFEQPTIVRCVKLLQGSPGVGDCSEIVLQFSEGGEVPSWSHRSAFSGVEAFAHLVALGPEEEASSAVRRTPGLSCTTLAAAAAMLGAALGAAGRS